MQTYLPYKDKFVRINILILGIILLILLNSIFIIYFVFPEYILYWFILLIFIGYFYWQKYNIFSKLKYCINASEISICIGNKKFNFEIDKIVCIKKYNVNGIKKYFLGWGVKYDLFSGAVFFTTSITKLYLLILKDGRKIVISPKEDLINLFLQKYKIKICDE